MSITILPSDVAAKIAAGEVVERPSSVVKELVENAIDAGAGSIRVEIKGGGAQLIRVTDDGCGIPSAEVPLAVERYATSKISSVDDLARVSTLGFRGEALASIGAVSEMTLISRQRQEKAARYVTVHNGRMVEEGWRGAPTGTTVVVKGLFRDFPARRKFLRSISTEAAQVSQVVCQYALAFPEIRFSLISEDRYVFQSPGTGCLREVMGVLYGPEVEQALRAVEMADDNPTAIALGGFVSDPGTHRATRAYLSFFVNRRWVRNRALSFALEEAYHGLLPEGRHPIAAIHLRLPPEEVDVNVHPAKLEIRFLHESAVYSTLQRSVRQALLEGISVSALLAQPVPVLDPFQSDTGAQSLPLESHASSTMTPPSTSYLGKLPAVIAGHSSSLRVLGQLGNTFIVAEGPDGMYLVDQHRAHERVLFEQMQAERRGGGIARQVLLEPEVIELKPGHRELAESMAPLLADLGFLVEPFGERSLLVREVPAALAGGGATATLQSIFDELAERADNAATGDVEWHERVLASLACRGAIKSGQALTQLEMHELVTRLERCSVRSLCPHAEPVMVHLSENAIRRQFGREQG